MKAFEFITAQNWPSAAGALTDRREGTLVKAGGIDVVDRLKERIDQPARVLSLRQLRDAREGIRVDEAARRIVIPALATLTEVSEHPEIRARAHVLAEAVGIAATPQVRNVATIGGNLCQKPRCWYFRSADFHCLKKGGDTCYAIAGDNRYHAVFGAGACHIVHPSNAAMGLAALKANVKTVRSDGTKVVERFIPIDDFYRVPPNPLDDEHVLEPGELIREIHLPFDYCGPRTAFVEVREKQSFDWPLVTAAVNLNAPREPRVVLGAVAPIPWRLRGVEQMLADRAVEADLLARAKAASAEGARPMSGNAYKLQLIGPCVERAIAAAAKPQ